MQMAAASTSSSPSEIEWLTPPVDFGGTNVFAFVWGGTNILDCVLRNFWRKIHRVAARSLASGLGPARVIDSKTGYETSRETR